MTDTADIILFAYALLLVGFSIGVQMLYVGAIRHGSMVFAGKRLATREVVTIGTVFTSAGGLAVAVAIVELLSGAAGTDLRAFGIATVLVPAVAVWYVTREQRAA
jgi:hypothetical protein